MQNWENDQSFSAMANRYVQVEPDGGRGGPLFTRGHGLGRGPSCHPSRTRTHAYQRGTRCNPLPLGHLCGGVGALVYSRVSVPAVRVSGMSVQRHGKALSSGGQGLGSHP